MKRISDDKEYLILNNGTKIPTLGLGVFLTPPEQTADAVETAISSGYRLIDTAAAYNNERQVGEAIRNSGIDRQEIFVTTKLWVADYGSEFALRAFEASIRRLQLEYIDLYLLHWPLPTDFDATVASYKVAEQLLAQGRVRAIGVSNFQPHHLKNLIDCTTVIPAVNQVELNPYFIEENICKANEHYGIATQSWSPIGGVYERSKHTNISTRLLDNGVIKRLAVHYGKTPAQIILRWHLEHGFSAIPKSIKSIRIKENFDVFDFSLTQEDVLEINSLNTGIRAGSDPEKFDRESYPIAIND